MPRSPETSVDPEFWNRLREALRSHMEVTGLKQKDLAPKLGIGSTTLNNFLNHQSETLSGLPVALACTIVDLFCDGKKIGRIVQSGNGEPVAELLEEQLVLEFDGAFEIRRESQQTPAIVLRKSAARHESLRLAIRRIG